MLILYQATSAWRGPVSLNGTAFSLLQQFTNILAKLASGQHRRHFSVLLANLECPAAAISDKIRSSNPFVRIQ